MVYSEAASNNGARNANLRTSVDIHVVGFNIYRQHRKVATYHIMILSHKNINGKKNSLQTIHITA